MSSVGHQEQVCNFTRQPNLFCLKETNCLKPSKISQLTFHMNDSPIALLVVDIWGWIHGLDFAEVDVSLVDTHIPKIEDDFVFVMSPMAVEVFI